MSDAHLVSLCKAPSLGGQRGDPAQATSIDRVKRRPQLLPVLREQQTRRCAAALPAPMEQAGLPVVRICKLGDLFDDDSPLATGVLVNIRPGLPRAGESTNALQKRLQCSLPDIQVVRDALAVA